MSAQSLADFSFPAFMIAIGVLTIFMPFEGGRGQPFGRWWGLLYIFIGVMNLLTRPTFMHERVWLLFLGSFALAMALYLLLIEPRIQARKQRRYEAELASRALAAADYSESLRAFHANSPWTQSPRRRVVGAVLLTSFGGLWLATGIATPR